MLRYIFDLDGVVLHTTLLNNKSYNYSLISHGFNRIDENFRITRDVVKNLIPNIDKHIFDSIIKLKQEFFITHINEVILDDGIIDIISVLKKEQCLLWTAADNMRAEHLISAFNLSSYFNNIIFLPKCSIKHDIDVICNEYSLQQKDLYVFEDDIDIINKLNRMKIKCLHYFGDYY